MFNRLFDFFFSFIVLTISLVPCLILAILIRFDSKGPVFFLQERMGRNKKIFTLFKFRTMTFKKRNPSGEVFLDNPDITKIGRVLRRYKIDEIPQFINVLIGHMSIVGPRPCLVSTYNKFKNDDTDFRFRVKPGITSNAGVTGSIFLDWNEKWRYDKEYALNKSFQQDLMIILKTILVVVFGEDKFLKKT